MKLGGNIILNNIIKKILSKEFIEGEKFPSYNDLITTYKCSRNNVIEICQLLKTHQIIENKIGMGFYLSINARSLLIEHLDNCLSIQVQDIISNAKHIDLELNDIFLLI